LAISRPEENDNIPIGWFPASPREANISTPFSPRITTSPWKTYLCFLLPPVAGIQESPLASREKACTKTEILHLQHQEVKIGKYM
jgi:hypothetical protein